MTPKQLDAAQYAVQKYRRLKEAREGAAMHHVTQSGLDTAQRAARHAETLFTCAMEELSAEFPEEKDDTPSPCTAIHPKGEVGVEL